MLCVMAVLSLHFRHFDQQSHGSQIVAFENGRNPVVPQEETLETRPPTESPQHSLQHLPATGIDSNKARAGCQAAA